MRIARTRDVGRGMALLVAGALAVALPTALCAQSALAPAQTAAAPTSAVHARGDIAGQWQGTIDVGKSMRLVVKIAKAEKGWSGKLYSIDQPSPVIDASTVAFDGTAFKFTVNTIGGSYEGKLSADGNSIAGTWTQGGKPYPLTMIRATSETAWEIPEPPAPTKKMAPDADPSFDVATIKPNPSGGKHLQGLTMIGRNFTVRNGSLSDLVIFAYKVQAKQIVGLPSWSDNDRYDIAAVPDVEGEPGPDQLRMMLRKLLAERFKLSFHHETRDLSAYVLTAGSNAKKLSPSTSSESLPGLGMQPGSGGLQLVMHNATLGDFTEFLQWLVLDRPVVDRTGVAGRFDYTVTFTPDDSEFGGHAPKLPERTDATESAPSLFEAIQQQLGMKLAAEKTAVDVIVVDHVEKPSAN